MSSVPRKRATVQLAINRDGSVASATLVSPGFVLRASLPLHSSVPGQPQGPAEPVLPPPPSFPGERRPVSECTLCLFLHQLKVHSLRELLSDHVLDYFFLNPCPSPPHTFQLGQLPQEKFSGSLLASSQDFREKNQVYDSVIVSDEWKLCLIEKYTLRWARSFFSESSQTPSPYVTLTPDNYMSALFCSYFANIPLLSHNFSTATSKQDFKIWPAW